MRAWIYDRALLKLTTSWYQSVLERLEPGARILDVGIGTGGALAGNANLVQNRDLHVTGVDIDEGYLKRAAKALQKVGLDGHVRLHHQSIYDYAEDGYDAIYFSASFMLMPDPEGALRHVQELLSPGGRVYFTQTFQEKPSEIVEKMKPLLKAVTTVDFGRVTYEEDFFAVLNAANLEILEHVELGAKRDWTYRLVVGQPMAA